MMPPDLMPTARAVMLPPKFHEKPRVRFRQVGDDVVVRVTCFYGGEAYALSGAGPTTDAAWADALALWRIVPRP